MEKILITGASGFIGSFIVEGALERGFEVWAGIRTTSSRKYLKDPRIHFLELDFAHQDLLKDQLASAANTNGKFDYIVHCAGLTKCQHHKMFYQVNYLQTTWLVDALRELDMVPKQFIYLSTLSLFGAIHEDTYEPITEDDTPCPNTAYGASKLRSEQYLQGLSGFPYVIFRPTGVYGPREKDYFLMAKTIKGHADFSVGYKRQDITFVYVKDVVNAIFLAIEKKVVRRAYFLTDGGVYSSRAFSDLIQKEMGMPWVLHVKSPLFVLKVVSLLAETFSSWFHRISTLNSDKYNIMKQRNWRCDITPTMNELGYVPQYPLERGVKETIAWYKKEGWL